MFTLRSLSLTSRRFGIGLAVAALAISTVAAPLSASAQESTIDTDTNYEIVPMAQKDNGPTNTPPGNVAPAAIPVHADLQVTARGKTARDGKTYYHFIIKNNGPAAANNFNAYKEAQTKAIIGNGFALVDNGYFTMSLASGAQKTVTVTCAPAPGMICTQASALTLSNPADPDINNNMATLN